MGVKENQYTYNVINKKFKSLLLTFLKIAQSEFL